MDHGCAGVASAADAVAVAVAVAAADAIRQLLLLLLLLLLRHSSCGFCWLARIRRTPVLVVL